MSKALAQRSRQSWSETSGGRKESMRLGERARKISGRCAEAWQLTRRSLWVEKSSTCWTEKSEIRGRASGDAKTKSRLVAEEVPERKHVGVKGADEGHLNAPMSMSSREDKA